MTSFNPQEILDLLDDPDVGVEGVRERLRASISAPTMDDIEWVDGVHDGLCAEHADYGLVRMIGPDTDGDIWFLTDQLKHDFSYPDYLTPIPGTRIDLTPRRESEMAPDHPTVLTTEEDYKNAPIGTIVAGEVNTPWTKLTPANWSRVSGINTHGDMAGTPRRVYRWGWEA